MIIKGTVVGLLILSPLVAIPVRADVLEIAPTGEAYWRSGPTLVVQQQFNRVSSVAADADGVSPSARNMVGYAAADPGLSSLEGIPPRYVSVVSRLAARYDLAPALIEALVWQESRWSENAVSPAGARGLTQLMPGTARDLGVNPDDPNANLEGGVRYLRQQLDRFNGNLGLALAAYNAGPGRVIQAGGIPRLRETQNYVTAIIGRLSRHFRSTQ